MPGQQRPVSRNGVSLQGAVPGGEEGHRTTHVGRSEDNGVEILGYVGSDDDCYGSDDDCNGSDDESKDWRLNESSTELPMDWHPPSDGVTLEDAVPGGEEGGRITYVGRAEHSGDVIPGKVVPDDACYVSYGGREHRHERYSILVNHDYQLQWKVDSNGAVPPNAVVGGRTCYGEKLYIGRAYHEGRLILGKIHPSHKCLYIPYGGREHPYKEYEVLVMDSIQPIR